MKKHLIIFLCALFIITTTSCTSNKSGQKNTEITNSQQSGTKQLDVDPYFKATQNTTSTSGPSSITRNILQDRNGDIWLASWEGIIKYDGKLFANYTNKHGLRKYHVFSILEDSKGILWFGTIGAGVYRYDGQQFTNLTKEHGLASDRVGCIYEDKKGNIWFGTDGGASCYNENEFQNLTIKDGLTHNDINSIIEDNTGNFWFGTRGTMCLYDGKTFTTFTTKEGSEFHNVRSIIKDGDDKVWFGGHSGLWRYDSDSLMKYCDDFVGYVYEDRDGNIWTSSAIGGDDAHWGISRYQQPSLQISNTEPEIIKQERNMYFGISQDTEGDIWFGSLQGVYRYNENALNPFE